MVSIVGSTFSDGERHSCKFGTTSQVAAFRQAASIIECLSPAHDVSNVHLGAANARVFEFSTTLTNFKYRVDAALFGVVPESVHDDAGARQVMIWGLGLSFPLEVAIGHLTGSVLTVSLQHRSFKAHEQNTKENNASHLKRKWCQKAGVLNNGVNTLYGSYQTIIIS